MSKVKGFVPVVSMLSILVLAGCNATNNAPIENADGTLSPGIAYGGDAASSSSSNDGWQPEIKQQNMPQSMQSESTKVAQNVQQAATQVTQKVQAQTVQMDSVDIPRGADNLPDYSQITKGSYDGNVYKVQKGDSLFLIAYLANKDVSELAKLNDLQEPYTLKVGQLIKLDSNVGQAVAQRAVSSAQAEVASTAQTYRVKAGDTLYSIARNNDRNIQDIIQLNNLAAPYTLSVGQVLTLNKAVPAAVKTATVKTVKPTVTYTQGANGTKYGSDGTVTGPIKAAVGSATAESATTVATQTVAKVTPTIPQTTSSKAVGGITWQWPTKGKIIGEFSSRDGGNKGIDIAGSRGQAIYAAAPGRVVYAGNALRGYGNLIIIKHNDSYLSAYAHNEKNLVKDQEMVKAGQKIATMGSSGTNKVKLHFEIRYKGKSVDPLSYLPTR